MLDATDDISDSACPVDHTGLLSTSTACCYQKLVMDPSCCIDKKFHKGVSRREFQRPGMFWSCETETGCYDTLRGRRGRDLMSIPDGATCSSPRILYIHGGSWMYSSPHTEGYAQFASRLAAATGAVVFCFDYPLVPYGNYSTILHRSIQALQWLAEHGPEDSCGSDARAPLFVGGDSSGGGTALSLVLELVAKPHLLPGRRLSGAFLFSPWTNLMCNTPEYYTNAFAQIKSPDTFRDLTPLQQYVGDIIFQAVTEKNSDEFSANALDYVGQNASLLQTDPIASPYFATHKHFRSDRMPPLHIMVGGSESILGDSLRVAHTAARGGATVSVEVYNGMWHVFPMYSEGCGSGEELWTAINAINSTGHFVRTLAEGAKATFALRVEGSDGQVSTRNLPLINYMYDPMVDKFTRVGELIPGTVSSYDQVMKNIVQQPWWVVLTSVSGTAVFIFLSGVCVGGTVDYGGREALKRAKRVTEYRKQFVEVPVGYVALDPSQRQRPPRSFLADFVMGVPEDPHREWRLSNIRAKHGAEAEAFSAARATNAAWRSMAMGYEPPPRAAAPVDSGAAMDPGPDAEVLMREIAADPTRLWALSTKEAKEGSFEAARRENISWRMQHKRSSEASSAPSEEAPAPEPADTFEPPRALPA